MSTAPGLACEPPRSPPLPSCATTGGYDRQLHDEANSLGVELLALQTEEEAEAALRGARADWLAAARGAADGDTLQARVRHAYALQWLDGRAVEAAAALEAVLWRRAGERGAIAGEEFGRGATRRWGGRGGGEMARTTSAAGS